MHRALWFVRSHQIMALDVGIALAVAGCITAIVIVIKRGLDALKGEWCFAAASSEEIGVVR